SLRIIADLRRDCFFFFFFQAEDGIRDLIVTGVQTCALPISIRAWAISTSWGELVVGIAHDVDIAHARIELSARHFHRPQANMGKIGRASCRERVWMPEVQGGLK